MGDLTAVWGSDLGRAVLAPWVMALVVGILGIVLPGRWVEGPVRSGAPGARQTQRCNGLGVALVVTTLWLGAGALGWVALDWFWAHRLGVLLGAATLGLALGAAAFLAGRPTGDAPVVDFVGGRHPGPRAAAGLFDGKLLLDQLGLVLLLLFLIGALGSHLAGHASGPAWGLLLAVGVLAALVFEHFVFEEVHLWSHDMARAPLGLRMALVRLVVLPAVPLLPLWTAVAAPRPAVDLLTMELALGLALASWGLSRGARLQKHALRARPGQAALGVVPRVVRADGDQRLVSGFWRWFRRPQDVGAVGIAVAVALLTGSAGSPWSWAFPLVVGLRAVWRAIESDHRDALAVPALADAHQGQVGGRWLPGIV